MRLQTPSDGVLVTVAVAGFSLWFGPLLFGVHVGGLTYLLLPVSIVATILLVRRSTAVSRLDATSEPRLAQAAQLATQALAGEQPDEDEAEDAGG